MEDLVSKEESFNYHPIQLKQVEVLELAFSKYCDDLKDEDKSHFQFMHTYSDFDNENKTFGVKVRAEVYPPQGEDSYLISAEIAGVFSVDTESFNPERIESFSRRNGPLILYPYLREQVFGLAARAGVPAPTLPLFQIPPFILSNKDSQQPE